MMTMSFNWISQKVSIECRVHIYIHCNRPICFGPIFFAVIPNPIVGPVHGSAVRVAIIVVYLQLSDSPVNKV